MLEGKYRKRSFLKFRESFDTDRLRQEVESISPSDWATTYWGNIHCSVGMLLLRGGTTGTAVDFFCEETSDNELLQQLPYINSIVGEDGPMGRARYVFLFRMIANGITKAHQDLNEAWRQLLRVHIPVTTNPDAVLISDNRVMHFAPGHAWSFDNYTFHGVVNGNSERVHLIMDFPLSDKLKRAMDEAEYLEGWQDDSKVAIINDKSNLGVASYPGDVEMMKVLETFKSYGWSIEQIADSLNAKGIPARGYNKKWTVDAICEFIPIVFWQ